MSSTKSKETKTTLTNEQRKVIIAHKDKNPQISQVNLVEWVKKTMNLDVHQSTISRLIKNKESIGENPSAKRQKTVQYPALENALYEWILQSQEHITLSDELIIEKAKNFGKMLRIPENALKFSHGWLYKFKKRHGLEQIIKHGEDGSVDDVVVNAAIPRLREILQEYDLKDIYNMDETGLFYRYHINNTKLIFTLIKGYFAVKGHKRY